jgi:hypothetical protein
MIKKLLITTTVGTITYYIIGWIIFEYILGRYTQLNTTNLIGFKKTDEQFSFSLLVISCMAYASLLSFILVYLLDIKNIFKAFVISSIIGTLVAIMTDTYWYATSNFYSNIIVVILDILAAGFTVGLMGTAITIINKKLSFK